MENVVYKKRETTVEAYFFTGTLRKDNKWVCPDWVVDEILKKSIIFRSSAYESIVADCNLWAHIEKEDLPSYLVYDYVASTEEWGTPSFLVKPPAYIVRDSGKVKVLSEDDFHKHYRIEQAPKHIHYKRVDKPPVLSYNEYPELKSKWIFVPAEGDKPHFSLHCQSCGYCMKFHTPNKRRPTAGDVREVMNGKHYCSNCGAYMINADHEGGKHHER